MAEIVVRLLAGDDQERSFFLSREFSSDVARLNGVVSRAPPTAASEPGQRGDSITIGAIVIAAVSGSGALTALMNTIGSYLARDHRIEVEIQTPDGRKVRISSQKFKQKEMEELLWDFLAMTGNLATKHEPQRQRECEQPERERKLVSRFERERLEHERRLEQERKLEQERLIPVLGWGGVASRKLTQLLQAAGHRDEYLVWYATNRRPIDPIDPSKGFSPQRDRTVHYGSCRVFIPLSHKIGSTGSPLWKRILTWTDDRLKLLETRGLDAATYWQSLAMHFDNIAQDDNSGVVFLHGYNVSFSDAALRAAQIGFDLSIKGAMAFFSWPSQGTLDGYSADEATIEASEDTIAEFLVDFAAKSGATKIHIIAHSMGNRGLLRAVNRIISRAKRRSEKQFDQIILAAADVDADVFRRDSGAYSKIARRATLYVSSRDRAVEASRWLHNYPRAGLMPPILIVPGIDTINVVNVDLTKLGHGYIAEARAVLTDIYQLFKEGKAPGDRFGIAAITHRQNEAYWEIRG